MLQSMDDVARYRWIASHILPHESQLRGWLRRQLGSLGSNDIDDVIQEAYARIWAADFSAIGNGRAYLYATVRHLLAEHARRSRIVAIELLGEIESLNLISGEPQPERQVSARQELAQLQAAVNALPIQCRRVFELVKFEGWSHREVAKHMRLSEKTVENHMTRALSRIGELLASTLSAADPLESSPGNTAKDEGRGRDW